ncbi:MAG: hypothetical protein K2X01_08190 [Cyanobacteria bacterium]|nr:hypothetical protein [Cyanobacteriota bacterium]
MPRRKASNKPTSPDKMKAGNIKSGNNKSDRCIARTIAKQTAQRANKHQHQQQALSREETLKAVVSALQLEIDDPEAHRFITLFQLEAEELSEAGLSFELLTALTRRHPLLFQL